ncbi:hypothetical protein MPL1032_110239 [Mesorhizobium plurifarium]|uniref:Uncharacterized protein n=1 Tax=Mesorhizobium plurifarium TaxID=69974 RepID=A0A0K2VPQ6_MESPL|nr:hypothetical protein MPL1032_110239 [Mesorhizobium plurifarium]
MGEKLLGAPGELAVVTIEQLGGQRGHHRAGRDRVGQYPLGSQLDCHRPRQMHDGGLGGDERALQAHRGKPDDRGYVDDTPALAASKHRRQRRSAHDVEAVEVDAGDAVPFLGGKFVYGDAVRQSIDAGVVDQDVEPSVPLQNPGDRGVDRLAVANVQSAGYRIAQAGRDTLGACHVDIGDDNRGPVIRKPFGDGASDCARRPCDQGDPIR